MRNALFAGLALAALLHFPRPLQAQTKVQELFAEANFRYESGDLQGALRGYTRLLALEPRSPQLHHNLALTYFRLGELGYARLAIERGLKIAPQSPWMEASARSIRRALVNRAGWRPSLSSEPPRAFAALKAIPLETLFFIFAALNALLAALVVLRRLKPSLPRHPLRLGAALLGLGLLSSAALAAFAYWQSRHSSLAIVVAPHATLRAAPHPQARSLGPPLIEGEALLYLGQEQGYMRVRSVEGTEGWLSLKEAGAARGSS